MSELTSSPVGNALRHAIVTTLRAIETHIAKPAPTSADVHLARRDAKRARALVRLAPRNLAVLARQTSKCVNQARRMFAGARDADVRSATLASLRPRLGGAHDALADMAGADTPHARVDFADIRTQVASLIRDWSLCDASSDGRDIVEAAIAGYRKGRRRARGAETGGTEELHNWRAAVVDHEYHASFLSAFAPGMRAQAKSADRLREYLGDINDLDMLAEFIHAGALSDEQRKAARKLAQAIAARRAKLLVKASRLGERMFARSPSKWGASLRRTCGR